MTVQAKVSQLTKFDLPNHPDIQDLLNLVAFGQTVGHGESKDPTTGESMVIVTGGTGATFSFTKKPDGSYTLTRYNG